MKRDMVRIFLTGALIFILPSMTPCRGQAPEIEIPVPESGKSAAETNDAKRKLPQRNNDRPTARRNARSRSDDALPSVDVHIPPALLKNEGRSTDEAAISAPKNSPLRPWAGAMAGDRIGPEPSWANPAAIPLRENENPLRLTQSQGRDLQRKEKGVAKAAAPLRKPAGRAENSKSESPGHSGFLSRFFQSKRHQTGMEQTPLELARRHRVAPEGRRDDPLATPSPRENSR